MQLLKRLIPLQITISSEFSVNWVSSEEEEEWMRANRRQSLAELCNPKLVRLAQVPHRTADREDPKLARRKWQPPHNMGEPQTENTLDNTFKLRKCTNGQILRSGSKLIEAVHSQQADLRGLDRGHW